MFEVFDGYATQGGQGCGPELAGRAGPLEVTLVAPLDALLTASMDAPLAASMMDLSGRQRFGPGC